MRRPEYVLAFTIEALPKLPNELTNRAHWRTVRGHAREWKYRVRGAVGKNTPPRPLSRAKVTLTRHSAREPDADNLAASWKPALDGLVVAGVLGDDGPEHVVLESRWKKAPRGEGYVSVIVEEIRE